MFVKLTKDEAYRTGVTGICGDASCGDVYIDINKICYIDANVIYFDRNYVMCSREGIDKVLSILSKSQGIIY